MPGAVRTLPSMPLGAFLLMVAGGLWLALWRTRLRRIGFAPLAIGVVWALLTPAPDLLVTGDGKHLAVREGGNLYLLRPRAGDYVRDLLGWGAGIQATALDLDGLPGTKCSDDACVAALGRGGRRWHVLATRSAYRADRDGLLKACAWADVAVSDRRLPWSCRPRWLKLDPAYLSQSGGLAMVFAGQRIESVNGDDHHPWVVRSVAHPKRRIDYRHSRRPSDGNALLLR